MSSQSSSHSNHFNDVWSEDDDTYSSGWERSSTSEDLPETEEEEDKYYIGAKGDFDPPSPYITGISDVGYKCEYVVLRNPYLNQPKEEKHESLDDDSIVESSSPEVKTWKKLENEGNFEDPWKFLEDMKPKPQERHVENRRPPQKPIDNSNTNKLCKYKNECRMNKNNNCNMVHSLAEWKPRICRFNQGCRRKRNCGYYHTDTPLAEYLKSMIHTKDTIYAKNSVLYEKYLQ